MKEHYDVIIVGTGAAGLYCALNLPEKMNILLTFYDVGLNTALSTIGSILLTSASK